MLSALGSAVSGIAVGTQMAASAGHNLANLQTTTPMEEPAFTGERPVFGEGVSGGTRFVDVAPAGSPEGVPLPGADGTMVRHPALDDGTEMVNLLLATHQVGANVATVSRAVDVYRDVLAMRKG